MILIIKGHTFRFEMENICRLFLPLEKIIRAEDEINYPDDDTPVAMSSLNHIENEIVLTAKLRLGGRCETMEERVPDKYKDEKELERRLAVLLYKIFAKVFDFTLPWGAVTGVRPVKLMRRLIEQQGMDSAVGWFREALLVSEDKISLCLDTLRLENNIQNLSRPESFSLYISIPFCPTRCDYCSFVSHTVERAAKLIPEYVEKLCREIEYTGKMVRQLGLRMETVYMGGGTPTTLSADQLAQILGAVENSFDMSFLREYTVEAGRPDTITEDKLRTIRSAGITRISINPQTLQGEVLKAIGRKHTAQQFFDAFALARKCGFDNINTDLIAGLPGDDYEGFNHSLDRIFSLSPESITVHTLAMKRASNLVVNLHGHSSDIEGRTQTVRMVDNSISRLTSEGYHPYYLYRQSKTVGGTENTGWSRPGYEGFYNVYIMDETHSILACGAGGVTKLRRPDSEYLERIFNYKFPYEYNSRFDDMLQRKERVVTFYENLFSQTQS